MTIVSIGTPTDYAGEFRQLWKELRLADALDPQNDLDDPIEVGNFDGANRAQWVMELKPLLVTLVIASFTYLITSRGEYECEKDGEIVRFKNLKQSQVKEVLTLLDASAKD